MNQFRSENCPPVKSRSFRCFQSLYLDTSKTTAVFFDEPELSLSIEWQKQLLPHIIESKWCAFLLATTHSPFIFENGLDAKASDLSEYIKFR